MSAPSQLSLLCRSHLALPGAGLAPSLDRQLIAAIAPTIEVGPRLLAQERFIASFVEPEAAGQAVFAGFALSGGRLWAGGKAIPLDALRRARRVAHETVELATDWGPFVVRTAASEALYGIIEGLVQIPKGQRCEWGVSLGEQAARAPVGPMPESFDVDTDHIVGSLYRLLWAMEARGGPAPKAALLDFAQRAVLLGRTLSEGRGMNQEGLWLSPLSAPDLADAFLHAIPKAEARAVAGGIEVRLSPTLPELFERVSGRGHNWALAGEPLADDDPASVLIVVQKLATMSGFTLELQKRPAAPAALRRAIFTLLCDSERRITVARTLLGWTQTALRLAKLPFDDLAQRALALDGNLSIPALLGTPSQDELRQQTDKAHAEGERAEKRARRQAALGEAKSSGDGTLVLSCARELAADVDDYETAHEALVDLARRDPVLRKEALVAQGEAALATLALLANDTSESIPLAERAVASFEEALRNGARVEELDDPYFAAARILAERHPSPHRRRGALDVYLRSFPHGKKRDEATRLLGAG